MHVSILGLVSFDLPSRNNQMRRLLIATPRFCPTRGIQQCVSDDKILTSAVEAMATSP